MKGGFKAKRARQRWKPLPAKVACGECGAACKPTKGEVLYPPGDPMAARNFYVCPDCHARVTCHMDTWAPMGTPASSRTRFLRRTAHATLDPIWLEQWTDWAATPRLARTAVYRWMAKHLGVPTLDFHIGMLNAEQCQKVIDLAKTQYQTREVHR